MKDEDFQNNIDAMINQMDKEIRQRETMRQQRGDAKSKRATYMRKLSDPRQFRYSKQLLCTMSARELGDLLCCLLPIAKVGDLKYMIGTEAKKIIVKSDMVLIRTGGGFMPLEEHINKYALSECLIIWRTMQQKNLNFNETVVNLLALHGADDSLLEQYQEETTDDISDLFEVIAALIK